jgi:putative ABC transport system permease protein
MRSLLLRILNVFRSRRQESELEREIASHLALLEDDFKQRGLSPEEGRRAARLALGGIDQTKELHREARSFGWIHDLKRDVRYALRTLAKSPWFTVAVVAILAIGIGANTAMFSVVNGVVLKPLGYTDDDRIVRVLNHWSDTGETPNSMPGGDEIDLSGLHETFESLAYYHGGEMGVQLGGHAEFVATQFVHPDFFRVFGLPPLAGRIFTTADARQSAIVSLAFAQRNFATAAGALGHSVFIEDRTYEIVGVVPERMRFPANTEVWAADSLLPENKNRSGFNYRVVAKLASGVSLEAANGRLAGFSTQLAYTYPDTNKRRTFLIVPLRDNLVSGVRATLFSLMGSVAFVLLIACANVANLMLARSSGRSREIAIRAALGARRRHLAGQLLAESILLALAAGAIGLAIARFATTALLQVSARYVPVPRIRDIHIDWRVLLFAAAVSMLTAVAFGLLPIYEISRLGIRDAISRAGSRGNVGSGSSRMRNGLVIAQIALSFMLAIDAGLLLRSFLALTDVSVGFREDHLLVTYAHAPARGSMSESEQSGLENHLQASQALDDIVDRLRHVPGVVSAGAVMGLPTGQYDADGSYAVEGKHSVSGDLRLLPHAGYRLSSPGYFVTMGIPVVRGRDFTSADLYNRTPVAIVSEALVRQSFPNEDPIGHRITWGLDLPVQYATIVGVVGDVRQHSPASAPEPQMYMPLRQHPFPANEVQIVLRSGRMPESLIPIVRDIVRTVNPDIATKFTTMEASVGDSIAAPRFRMTLVSIFASIALLLAAAGMYAVMSYTTTQRMSEFAVRLALGAESRGIISLVLGGAARLTLIGVVAGLILVAATHRVIAPMLFGIDLKDIMTYALVLLAMLPAVTLAAALPAIRAARVDPMTALRTD